MAVQGVRYNVTQAAAIDSFLDGLHADEKGTVADEVLRDLGKLVKAEAAERQIVRGRGNAPPLAKRLSYRTGHLTRSIGTDFSQATKRYIVGTPVSYGPVHELGLGPYPKRAFLEPAAELVIGRDAAKLFRLALERLRRRS